MGKGMNLQDSHDSRSKARVEKMVHLQGVWGIGNGMMD
jgi:hypothetical protein